MKARAGNRWALLAGIGIGLVFVAAVVLRFVAQSDLWLDEALSVNIAKLPLGDLYGALKRDGAPPLYYVFLHFWIDVFGDSDRAVRSLSAVFSLATLPAFYFAGRRLGGRAAAWVVLLVAATSPFAFRYATEARMYALVMFLVAWGYLAVVRALERPTLGRLSLVALVVASLLYTHNWSWYLLAAVFVVVALRAWRGTAPDDRRSAIRVLLAMVVGGLLYVPWLPTLSYQLAHTGTPWGDARLPWSAFTEVYVGLIGLSEPPHAELYVLGAFLLVLPLLAVFGAAVDSQTVQLDLRTRPTVRWEAVVAYGTLALGLTLSWIGGTAFEARYAAVAVPLILVVTAMGILVFASLPVRVVVLAAVVLLGISGGVRNAHDDRTQAGQVAAIINAEAKPGDLVVYCPDQLGPSVHRLLNDNGLIEVTFPDLARPERVDWVDYRDHIAATDPNAVARGVLKRADGAPIWYVVSPGYRSVEGKCEGLGAALAEERPDRVTRVAPDDQTFFEFMGLTQFAP